jgi:hypothetical protein
MEKTVTKHFVVFYSPGTFIAEVTEKALPKGWDIELAKQMARGISERYGATPYGFCFTTRERGTDDLDSRETHRSHMYFLGGKVRTLAEVEADNNPNEEILRSNMRGNGYDRIITNDNSWRWTQPLGKDDVVLEFSPPRPKNQKAGKR